MTLNQGFICEFRWWFSTSLLWVGWNSDKMLTGPSKNPVSYLFQNWIWMCPTELFWSWEFSQLVQQCGFLQMHSKRLENRCLPLNNPTFCTEIVKFNYVDGLSKVYLISTRYSSIIYLLELWHLSDRWCNMFGWKYLLILLPLITRGGINQDQNYTAFNNLKQ